MPTPVLIGLDPARPGSDMTVLAVLRDQVLEAFKVELPPAQPTSTAVEIEMRLASYMAKHGHLYDRMRKMWPLRRPSVACIKYGRRKPTRRVLFGCTVGLLTGKAWQPQVRIETKRDDNK